MRPLCPKRRLGSETATTAVTFDPLGITVTPSTSTGSRTSSATGSLTRAVAEERVFESLRRIGVLLDRKKPERGALTEAGAGAGARSYAMRSRAGAGCAGAVEAARSLRMVALAMGTNPDSPLAVRTAR